MALGPTAPLPQGDDVPQLDEKRRKALTELKDWFEEWSTAARAVVKKRGHLIRLGLANRKSPTPKKAVPDEKGGGESPK
ncbi:MAG: hypothetical protein ABI193_09260 [Minicystis sp.]